MEARGKFEEAKKSKPKYTVKEETSDETEEDQVKQPAKVKVEAPKKKRPTRVRAKVSETQ
jgi:hypothetical protein